MESEFKAVDESMLAEYINGHLYTHAREDTSDHIRMALFERLKGAGRPFDLFGELHLGNDVLVPQFAAWVAQPEVGKPWGHYSSRSYTAAPDWVCEIVASPQHASFIASKLPIYHREGVSTVWVIYPESRQAEVLHRAEHPRFWDPVEYHTGRGTVTLPPFEGVELDLGKFWPSPEEIDAAERKAARELGEQLAKEAQTGLSDTELLQRLLRLMPVEHDKEHYSCADLLARGSWVPLRAWAYAVRRVPIQQAVLLARLEIAAEEHARQVVSREEAAAMSEQYLHDSIQEGLEQAERGELISHEEVKQGFEERRKERERKDREDRSPLRLEVEAELALFAEAGDVSKALLERVWTGPGTRYIPHDRWGAIVAAIVRRTWPGEPRASWPGLAERAEALLNAAKNA